MKNVTISFLLVATCQLIAVGGIKGDSAESLIQLRTIVEEVASPKENLFRKVEDAREVFEKEVHCEFQTNSSNAPFSPFYFVRRVELCSRSTLDGDHNS